MIDSLVVVDWADAHQETEGWTAVNDLCDDGERIIRTVGLLLPVTFGGKHGHISVAQAFDESEQNVDNVMHIPASMVRKITIRKLEDVVGRKCE